MPFGDAVREENIHTEHQGVPSAIPRIWLEGQPGGAPNSRPNGGVPSTGRARHAVPELLTRSHLGVRAAFLVRQGSEHHILPGQSGLRTSVGPWTAAGGDMGLSNSRLAEEYRGGLVFPAQLGQGALKR